MKRTTVRRTAGASKSGGGFSWAGFIFKSILVIFLLLALPLGFFGAKVYNQLKDMPDLALLENYTPIEAIQIYDRNDKLVCTVEGDEDRRTVKLSEVAAPMQRAILAAEDHHFYEHHGINLMSIMRAFVINLQAHRVVEGGSTITQQLIKNLFFEDKGRTLDRKVKEAFMSYEIERRYTKDHILQMYLNQVYFGNGGYGIERAAERWFGKSAAGLDLAQSAFLAGLVKAPSELGNPDNREAALQRQHEILDRMVEFGYVIPQQAEKAKKEVLKFKKNSNPLQRYPYYVSFVLEQLRSRFSEAEMRRQGLRVYTNLDPQVQDLAEKTLNEDLKHTPKGVSQAALVCVSVKDGSVLALVGGVGDYWKNQFNRATNPHTAGSSFKPFVYLTAFLRHVLRPDSIIDDSPIVIKQGWGLPDWAPHNFDHKFLGKITIIKALSQSRNVPAVKVGQIAGVDHIIETARLAGISPVSKLEPNLSLALGSCAVTPLDMAGAYSTFARGGIAIKPQTLRRIENNRGQLIESFEPRSDKVFDPDAVARLVGILQEVVRAGTGTAARMSDRPVAGKTGTADQGKDIWFCGFTPDTVCTVWGGNDENLPIPGHNVTGGAVMAKIWKDFMSAYYAMRPTAPGAFAVAAKDTEPLPIQDSAQPNENGELVPNLVPIAPDLQGGPELVPPTGSPSQDSQTAPPAVSPTTAIPTEAPVPAPAMEPSYSTAPPVPARAPNVVPQYTMPPVAPPPAAAVPYTSTYPSSYKPGFNPRSISDSTSGAAPVRSTSAYITGSGAKRTIINDENQGAYSYSTDTNVSPGLGKRRFIPAGGVNSQPAGSLQGQNTPGF
jgi:1A family penicillin-binding protein